MDSVKVLIVEDHTDVRTMWRQALEAQGYVVFEAASLRAGMRGLEESPDIIIADWMLNGETADLLLDSWVPVGDGPFLVISDHQDDGVSDELLTRGAWHVMHKPISLLVLTSVLHRYRAYVELERGMEFMQKEIHRLKKLIILAALASVGLAKIPWGEVFRLFL